ncbi:hypothetical protein [Cupriavidus metallidurans]|uniref:hypothetical protein n=1 Tax=Cupriavidus metallidurans TaxID=119219 RepID=UPI000569694D|nr:hypothetical protein [Cupriavidus metallidurans]
MSNTPLRTQSIIQVQERALELGWFHDLEVSFSYWHGGKLLLDGPKFQWPNETVLEDVRDEGQRLCRIYDISSTSSLELLAFRVDREVPRAKSPSDGHWHYPERDQGLPPTLLRSCHLIWSSKTGEAPTLRDWHVREACFAKYVPIVGTCVGAADLLGRFFVQTNPLAQDAMRRGLAIFDGQVSHLTIDEEPSGPGGRFIRVAGQISIATAPGSPRTSDAELLDTVGQAAAIDVRPTGRDLHWDTTRLDKEQQSWSWRNP